MGTYQCDVFVSGDLLAVKLPKRGLVEVQEGLQIWVRSGQCCLFVARKKVADILIQGLYSLHPETVPVFTRLVGWRRGTTRRTELWFFSGEVFRNRSWETEHGVGTYDLFIQDPRKLFEAKLKTKNALSIFEVDAWVNKILGKCMSSEPQLEANLLLDTIGLKLGRLETTLFTSKSVPESDEVQPARPSLFAARARKS